MHFIGVDLAWGEKSRTGVAVIDDHGVLQHLSSVITDEEIAAAVTPYLSDRAVAGIDAPLVVTNETGTRRAEKLLNHDFAKFDAGAHPANRANPAFTERPRGARVCALLGFAIDPSSSAPRRAVEVYPHAATVALFRLGRTLKYKNKQGRSVDDMRTELLALTRLVESLSSAQPAAHVALNTEWRELVASIEGASRKSQLRMAEDQVDAVICAYVVYYREHRPTDVVTYGQYPDGYIVTPRLPADLVPSPRPPRAAQHVEVVRRATRRYAGTYPLLRRAADEASAVVVGILDDAGLNYLSVTGRAKSIESFAEKAGRMADGVPLYADPIAQIGDTIGLRVITYVHSDVAAVAQLLASEAEVLDDRDMGQETASEGRFGYASRHLQIRLAPADQAAHPAVGDRPVQVQIRTVLQHAWAEFEHDIRYKGTVPDEYRSDFDRRFSLAAGLLELADQEFSTIRERLRSGVHEVPEAQPEEDPRISPRELAAFLAGQYADSSWSRPEHYAWIAGLVLELGITSLAELAESIRAVDMSVIDHRMGYRSVPGAVRRLDDALLVAHGERYIALHDNAHRVDRLKARLVKMTKAA
ncbi:DUF429 domain-containing protein [Yimella sp. cx-573]|nr:DUF429 domain-containing protein [Yimella sp. cx-573]